MSVRKAAVDPRKARLAAIMELARGYASTRQALAARVEALDALQRRIARRRLPGVRRAIDDAANARNELAAAIDRNRDLFGRPRSVTVEGIKVGLQKGKGELAIGDPTNTVKLIRRHLAEQADVLIKVSETPVKSALASLTAAEMKRIGVELVETGDQVLIKPVDGAVEKLVEALLKAAADDIGEDSDG